MDNRDSENNEKEYKPRVRNRRYTLRKKRGEVPIEFMLSWIVQQASISGEKLNFIRFRLM